MIGMKDVVVAILSIAFIGSHIAAFAAGPKSPSRPNDTAIAASKSPTPSPLPSSELATFMAAHLDTMTGPLESKAPLPKAELANLQKSFKTRLRNASPTDRKQLNAALAVCKAFGRLLHDRERAMLRPTMVAEWPQRGADYREVIGELLKKEKATEQSAAGAAAAPR